ncbi:hypothetical protein MTR_4g096720 [Medicago truncatula]|uniref:Uncharacterized protein n=1 Tax=Medicago truncatula TaxID=3880 RepID=G7JDZ0_MEDTR|nr:hypothetical protein MTR_4g096720 [Medicago truncatula]
MAERSKAPVLRTGPRERAWVQNPLLTFLFFYFHHSIYFDSLFHIPDNHCYGSSTSRINYDVACLYYHIFCLHCGEEAHTPVDCETVTRWMKKKNSDFQITTTTTRIIANTKPCPKCKIHIEKNNEIYKCFVSPSTFNLIQIQSVFSTILRQLHYALCPYIIHGYT